MLIKVLDNVAMGIEDQRVALGEIAEVIRILPDAIER